MGSGGRRRARACENPSGLHAGIATLGMGEEEKTEERKVEHVIKTYAGVSKKVRVCARAQTPSPAPAPLGYRAVGGT